MWSAVAPARRFNHAYEVPVILSVSEGPRDATSVATKPVAR